MLEGQTIISSERKYKIYNAIGIALIVALCVWLSVERGLLTVQSDNHQIPPHSLVRKVMYLNYAVVFLILVSAAFFCDALRRIKSSLNRMPHLMAD